MLSHTTVSRPKVLDDLFPYVASHKPSVWGRDSPRPSVWGRDSRRPSLWGRDSPRPSVWGRDSRRPSVWGRDSPRPSMWDRDSPRPSVWGRDSSRPSVGGRNSLWTCPSSSPARVTHVAPGKTEVRVGSYCTAVVPRHKLVLITILTAGEFL